MKFFCIFVLLVSAVLCQHTLSGSTMWRFKVDTAPIEAGWNTAAYINSWPTSTVANLPGTTGVSGYYCASFDIASTTVITSAISAITTTGGYSLYMNGVEMKRLYLPPGELTVNTESTRTAETSITFSVGSSFAGSTLGNWNNLVCVEIHTKTPSVSNTFGYDLSFEGNQDDLLIDGTLTGYNIGYSSPPWIETLPNAANKVHNDKYNTNDATTCSGVNKAYVQWNYNADRQVNINYLKFFSGTNDNRKPYSLSIEGSDDNTVWMPIQTWNVQGTWGGSYASKEYTFVNTHSYNRYKVYFWGCSGSEGIEMAEFYLGTRSTVAICPAVDGYTASFVGSRAKKTCPIADYEGGLFRQCNTGPVLDPAVIDECQSSIPNNLVYGIQNQVTIVMKKEESIIPTYIGIATDWIITPDLPNNLLIDPVTGVIKGRLQTTITGVQYTVTASNDRGSTTAIIIITSVIVNCEATSEYAATAHEEYAVKKCPLYYIGYSLAQCLGGVFEEPSLEHCSFKISSFFHYSVSTITMKNGVAIQPLTLVYDAVFSTITVLPELPTGLVMSTVGVLSGIPTVAAAQAVYTVTGMNTKETKTFELTITVVDNGCPALDSFPAALNGAISSSTTVCPALMIGTTTRLCNNGVFGPMIQTGCAYSAITGFTYSPNTITVVSGTAVRSVDPTYTGFVDSFSIVGPTGSGLSLNNKGVLAGVAKTVGTTVFTIRAANTANNVQTTVTVTVTATGCSGVKGVNLANGEKSFEACNNDEEGQITRTCTNGLLSKKDLTGCKKIKPNGLTYSESSILMTVGVMYSSFIPFVNGTIQRYTIDPAISDDVNIDGRSGMIRGTPMETKTTAVYTVTAMNPSGDSTFELTITIQNPQCVAMKDFPATSVGESVSFDCVTINGFKGTSTRTCTLMEDKITAMWSSATDFCIQNKVDMFMIIGVILIVIGVVLLVWGILLMINRESKTLPKTEASKLASTKAPVVVVAPTAAPVVPIAAPTPVVAPAPAPAPAPVPTPVPAPVVDVPAPTNM